MRIQDCQPGKDSHAKKRSILQNKKWPLAGSNLMWSVMLCIFPILLVQSINLCLIIESVSISVHKIETSSLGNKNANFLHDAKQDYHLIL